MGGSSQSTADAEPEASAVDPTASAASESHSTLAALAPIAIIVAIGAILRISQIGQSLFADEMWSYVGATQPDFGQMLDFVRSDEEITPPLFTALAWLSAKLGDPTITVRLPGLLAGIATIPLVYALGLRTLGRRVALAAAALAALSPFLAWYSIEVRAYAVAIALVTASTLCLLIALERNRTRWWVAYAALSCAAMYTHYTAAYPLLAQLVWAFWLHPGSRRSLILANVAAAVAFLPWLPGLQEDLSSPTQGIIGSLAPLTLDRAIDFTARFAAGHPAIGLDSFWGTWAEFALACGVAVALAGLAVRWRRGEPATEGGGEQRRALGLFMMIAVAAPAATLLVSLVGDNQLLPRNLATSSSGLILVIAALLCAGPFVYRAVSLTLILGTFAYGAIRTTEQPLQRPAYGDAAAFIDAEADPDDVVLDIAGIGGGGTGGEPLKPPTFTLDIELDRQHNVIDSVDLPAAERALEESSGNRLFLVGNPYFVAGTRAAIGLGDADPVTERIYGGLIPLTVLTFEISADPSSGDT